MIAPMPNQANQCCTFESYTPAWRLGTGLRVSLPPGSYEVTGEDHLDERTYFRLDDAYRIDGQEILTQRCDATTELNSS